MNIGSKGHPHVSHLRRWQIDAPRAQRLCARLTSTAPTALVAVGRTYLGMAICGCLVERGVGQSCHPFGFAQGRLSAASRPGRNDRDAKNAQKARLSGRDDSERERRARLKSCAYIRTKGKSTARLAVPRAQAGGGEVARKRDPTQAGEPRSRLGTRATHGVVGGMDAGYSDEAIIYGNWPSVPMRRSATATQGPGHGEQDSSCRNPSVLMKNL